MPSRNLLDQSEQNTPDCPTQLGMEDCTPRAPKLVLTPVHLTSVLHLKWSMQSVALDVRLRCLNSPKYASACEAMGHEPPSDRRVLLCFEAQMPGDRPDLISRSVDGSRNNECATHLGQSDVRRNSLRESCSRSRRSEDKGHSGQARLRARRNRIHRRDGRLEEVVVGPAPPDTRNSLSLFPFGARDRRADRVRRQRDAPAQRHARQ